MSIVREFYANMSKEPRTKTIFVRGVEVSITPLAINKILGTHADIESEAFIKLQL